MQSTVISNIQITKIIYTPYFGALPLCVVGGATILQISSGLCPSRVLMHKRCSWNIPSNGCTVIFVETVTTPTHKGAEHRNINYPNYKNHLYTIFQGAAPLRCGWCDYSTNIIGALPLKSDYTQGAAGTSRATGAPKYRFFSPPIHSIYCVALSLKSV